MKKSLLSGLLASLLLGFAGVLRAEVTPGHAAPDVSFTDISGKAHKLSDFKGKTVVLEWVNPQCPFVKYHYEKAAVIPKLQKEAAAEGVVWISINSGHPGAEGDLDDAAVKAWTAKTGAAPAAYVRDSKGELGKLFGAKTTPHLFIINAEGTLVYEGAIDNARGFDREKTEKATNYVRTTLSALKEGKPVSPATSQPYGCSVKY